MTKRPAKSKDADAPADAAPASAPAPAKKGRKPRRETSPNQPDVVQIGEKWFVVFD